MRSQLSQWFDQLEVALRGNSGFFASTRNGGHRAGGQRSLTWPADKRPIMVPEGDPRLSRWSVLAANAVEWMEDAKRIAVAGYRQVREDGRDVSNSESDTEYSDHGEELEGIYTKGATLASARLSTAQANAPRYIFGGRVNRRVPAMFERLAYTCQRDYSSGSTTDRRSLQGAKDLISVWLNWAPCPAAHMRGIRPSRRPSGA
jgi:hypothetical protein